MIEIVSVSLDPQYSIDVLDNEQVEIDLSLAVIGPRGPKGETNKGFDYQQPIASPSWVIAHNLGFKPDVTTLSIGGLAILGSVVHLSDNVVQINFNSPVAGTAHLI